jgi:6,7-dimethyl-8-ribityllumazine synthase
MDIKSGNLIAHQGKIALIVSRFNKTITSSLLEGALDTLQRHGKKEDELEVFWVPGAFEIPLIAKKLAQTGNYQAVVCLGAVIRGETAHFDFVAGQSASGITQASLDTQVPIIFGVITTENVEQTLCRSGIKGGNRGDDAACAALEMIDLMLQIEASPSSQKPSPFAQRMTTASLV